MSRRMVRALARILVIFAVPGCGLILDPEPPLPSPSGSEAERLECFVTVRNGDLEVMISSITHEDFRARREYFTCVDPHCPTTCSRRTIADAEADWSRWVRSEIQRIRATDPTSTFSMADEGWCQVPGSLRCEPLGTMLTDPVCDDLPPLDPLEVCPPAVDDACVEVSCPDPGCTEIDFGGVPVSATPGAGASRTVVVSNCGDVDVRTQIDQSIVPLGARSEFEIPGDTFMCGPRTPEEMMLGRVLEVPPGDSDCSFDVVFRPTMPLDHAGRKVFWSEALSDHTIELRGFGIGGGLVDDVPPTPLCLTEATPCSAEVAVTLTNGGPGPVIIRGITVSATNFEVVSPTPAMLPITLNAGDPPLEVRVRWCVGPPGALTGTMWIDTSERRIATDLETRPSCP